MLCNEMNHGWRLPMYKFPVKPWKIMSPDPPAVTHLFVTSGSGMNHVTSSDAASLRWSLRKFCHLTPLQWRILCDFCDGLNHVVTSSGTDVSIGAIRNVLSCPGCTYLPYVTILNGMTRVVTSDKYGHICDIIESWFSWNTSHRRGGMHIT